MAIYKNTSSKGIVRKIMRDLNPTGDNWVEDAIEWIGEALEHIGSAPQLETKTCVLTMKDYKAVLPSDLFYINQVALNETEESVIISEQMDRLVDLIDDIVSGTRTSTYTLNELNARVQVLENQFSASDSVTVLTKCRTSFPQTVDCPDCVNDNNLPFRCYYVEADMVKTSFKTGKICLSYMAFPVDDDYYPMVPDDISFKEAMFWYVYKKMLLSRGQLANNGIDYVYADQQWKYYCTQARNSANFPDIDGYESFMDQWVRLVPNMNRHSEGFGTLNQRESLSRDKFDHLVHNAPISTKVPTKASSTSLTRRPTSIYWVTNSSTAQNIAAGLSDPVTLNNPESGDISSILGTSVITPGPTSWLITGLASSMTLNYSYTLGFNAGGQGSFQVEIVMKNNNTGEEIVLEDTDFNITGTDTSVQGNVNTLVGSISSATVFIRIAGGTNNIELTGAILTAGNLKID